MRSERSLPTSNMDSIEIRYQKALRQLTKAMQANQQYKNQIYSKENIIQQITQQLKQVILEKNQLSSQLATLTLKSQQLEQENVKLVMTHKNHKKMQKSPSTNYDLGREPDTAFIPLDNGLSLKKKFQQQPTSNKEKQRNLYHLEQINEENINKIRSLMKQCEQLSHKNQQLESILKMSKAGEGNRKEEQLEGLTKSTLIKKVKITNKWADTITKECRDLKAKVVRIETDPKIPQTERLGRYSSPVSSGQSTSHPASLFDEYMINNEQNRFTQLIKKGKKIETQNKSLIKRYEKTKDKLQKVTNENISQRKELEKLRKQNEGYEKIIEKQENEIKKLIDCYEKDIEKMTLDFKQKLEEQRRILGSKKAQKKIKQMESIEEENKFIKKKCNMLTQELSKCLKLLDHEKNKFNQFQNSFKHVAEENHTLKEKIKLMQKPQKIRLTYKQSQLKSPPPEPNIAESERISTPKKNYLKQSYDESSSLRHKNKQF